MSRRTSIALVYLGLRDWAETRQWLTRALDERVHWSVWLLRDPRWDPLRGDPEFERLVDRVGFPADARPVRRPRGPGRRPERATVLAEPGAPYRVT